MTVAGRISVLFMSAAIVMGLVASFAAATREYTIRLDQVLESSRAGLLSRPDLQIHIYNRDTLRLEKILAGFLEPGGVSAAAIFSGLGELLARRDGPAPATAGGASFAALRSELLATESRLLTPDASGKEIGQGLVTSLLHSDAPMYLSMPIFSVVNQAQRGLQPEDFARALAAPDDREIQHVIGYLHVVIDRSLLLRDTAPAVRRIMLGGLVFALLLGGLAWFLARRITEPLKKLAELADEVASGRLEKPMEIEGSGEVEEIARVLNGMLGGFHNHIKERDVDRHLLSMKVEERSSQLTARSEELDRAVETVTETRNQLQHLANYDSLTNLPNRRLFTEQLDMALRLNRRNKHILALLFIDLDDFKRINDSLGLNAGDQLLKEVAGRLATCLRESDLVAHFETPQQDIGISRLGGDEFTVILNQVEGIDAARQVAQRVIDELSSPVPVDGHDIVVKTSVGVALAPADGDDVESLLKAASTAKYHAKRSSAGRLEFYDRDMGSAGAERIKLESELRKALARDELVLHYQPQVDTLSGSVVGAEALLRWEHPELGLLQPGKFIVLAEEAGIIAEIGEWVLLEACRQLTAFDALEVQLPRVSINVSAVEFDSGFVQRVRTALQETGVSPERLELGLTEAIMFDNDADALQAMQELREIGVYLSVDDFGTGYSPLGYLSRYPLNEMKIDRSFVLDSEKSENGARLITAIIAMARSLDLRILAAGVESEKQVVFLTEQGAHILQGYLFSKPVPAEELKVMLAPWHFIDQVQKIMQSAGQTATERFLESNS